MLKELRKMYTFFSTQLKITVCYFNQETEVMNTKENDKTKK